MQDNKQERHTRRAQQQLLNHYRDLQSTLYSLSKDFGRLGLDLPYNITLTKTFYAHAHDGTPIKATLALTLVNLEENAQP